MTAWTIVRRSLRFYWRTNLSVVLASAVGTAVLVGALTVGDSVRGSLERLALARLGNVELALAAGDRYFRADLAGDMQRALGAPVAPALVLGGSAANADGSARAGRVQVVGADERFWQLGPEGSAPVGWAGEVVLNRPLADRLGAGAGDTLLLRVEKPSPLPRDAPLSIEEGSTVAFRIRVGGVASEGEFGRFSLRANQVAPLTVFVPLSILQDKVGLGGKVNTLLVGRGKAGGTAEAQESLRRNWQLADADLELRTLGEQGALELRSGRVFIDTAIAEAAPRGLRILTYFVNELRAGGRSTPYSIVTAIDPAGEGRPASAVPPDMKDDEILLNAWVADDLEARPGDTVELTYFVVGPMRRLHEEEARFRVRAILPMEGAAADRELMPALPGLAGVENCRDWKAGIPIRFEKIRDKDEEYWDRYGGTPKAFVTLRAGRRMWGNRFGNLTALRYPLDGASGEELWASMRRKLDPAAIGLYFRAVRDEALAASREGTDFGHLFLGMSFFLIVAAALLTGLLFVFSVEHRAQEVGTLLALGFRPSRVRRVLLAEGAVLAIAGGLLGTFAGVFYTKAVLYGLATVWSEAVSEATLRYHAEASTLAAGFAAGVCVALLSMWFTLRKQARLAARELLASVSGAGIAGRQRVGLWLALAAIVPALVILLLAGTGRGWSAAGAFFASGALLLAGAIGLSHWLMSTLGMSKRMTLAGMGLRNASRRLGRSLLTVALLACGCFLIVAVSANRLGIGDEIERRDSGTGGFALFGESTLPVFSDLNTGAGRDAYGLESSVMEDVRVVAMRVREGDDASCLNLNRAQTPRLFGVRPDQMSARGAFTFLSTIDSIAAKQPWLLLNLREDDDIVPAIGDEATVVYGLGKSLGDVLPYVDGRGRTFKIRIVGVLANSILQGNLLISEEEFIKRFPAESGYRAFLIDAPASRVDEVRRALGRALADVGLDVVRGQQRLAEFNVVQNTYLSVFQTLGGLGLLLGSAGLGMVVLRNVMERRGELALLRAVGYRRGLLRWLVLAEHLWLLVLGVGCGVITALVAVLPALASPATTVPVGTLALTLGGVMAGGVLWVWLASVFALRGPLLAALRNE